jgi:arylsulfatase A-like enzyme
MKRFVFLSFILKSLFLFFMARFAIAAEEPVKEKPNIILCMADDQGWGDVGYNGHPVLKTPHLDEMAGTALRFDRFYATSAFCTPTRAAILTGRHPNRFGCYTWGGTLRPQEVTIAEALKKAGYTTGHFGKWHVGSVLEGSPVNPGASGFDEWFSAPNFFDNDPVLSREGKAVQTQGESSMVVMDAALQFISKQAQTTEPFLTVIWFGSPHLPHEASEANRKLYPDQDEAKQNFYGEITGVDNAVGKLREKLRDLGIHENTAVWYCSDNGGLDTSSTGGRGKKGSLYDGGLRVPSILEWPAYVEEPQVIDIPCNTVDIFPTLLHMAGITNPPQTPLDGMTLLPIIDGKIKQRRVKMGFWQYPAQGRRTPSHEWMQELLEAQNNNEELENKTERLCLDAGKIAEKHPWDSLPGHAALIDWPWKLHRIVYSKDSVKFELYNLDKDPGETNNIVYERRVRGSVLENILTSWQKDVIRSLNGRDYK